MEFGFVSTGAVDLVVRVDCFPRVVVEELEDCKALLCAESAAACAEGFGSGEGVSLPNDSHLDFDEVLDFRAGCVLGNKLSEVGSKRVRGNIISD